MVTFPVAFCGTMTVTVPFPLSTISIFEVEFNLATEKVVVLLFGRYFPSPLYVTTTVLSPTASPGTATVTTPSVMPTVLLNSSPIVTVTLPVAPGVTVMFMTAASPSVMLSAVTATSAFVLLTLNVPDASALCQNPSPE